jgi:hypothetical protein
MQLLTALSVCWVLKQSSGISNITFAWSYTRMNKDAPRELYTYTSKAAAYIVSSQTPCISDPRRLLMPCPLRIGEKPEHRKLSSGSGPIGPKIYTQHITSSRGPERGSARAHAFRKGSFCIFTFVIKLHPISTFCPPALALVITIPPR